ncbi:MAG: hypothetical protein D6712_17195 [Chloroflexi bacterium]|nr:MAG: hypothetical protein D6712_17195 [Chloroflexota bacterium]
METKLGLYWGSFILSAMPWLIGFYAQKMNNYQLSDAYRFKSGRLWVWLLGLQPNKDYVYIGPAIFQIWALLALFSGFVAIYFWGNYGFRIVLYTIYVGGIVIMALVGWIMSLINQR